MSPILNIEWQTGDRVALSCCGRSLVLVDASPDLAEAIGRPEIRGHLQAMVTKMGEERSSPSIPAGYLEEVLRAAGLLAPAARIPHPVPRRGEGAQTRSG